MGYILKRIINQLLFMICYKYCRTHRTYNIMNNKQKKEEKKKRKSHKSPIILLSSTFTLSDNDQL